MSRHCEKVTSTNSSIPCVLEYGPSDSCPCCFLADDYFEPKSSPFDDFSANEEFGEKSTDLGNMFDDNKGTIRYCQNFFNVNTMQRTRVQCVRSRIVCRFSLLS